jgi:hypothetical protein
MGFLASKARPVWRESEMMQRCFSSFYWHFSIGTIDMKDLVDQCVVNREWNCLVKTSRGIKYDWTPFINFIHPYFLKLPIKGEGTLRFGPPWMNVYEKGGYQEAHHHVANGNQLSYCYFYRLPEKSGQFGFFNENYRTQCANQFNEVLAVDEIVEWSFPKVSRRRLADLSLLPHPSGDLSTDRREAGDHRRERGAAPHERHHRVLYQRDRPGNVRTGRRIHRRFVLGKRIRRLRLCRLSGDVFRRTKTKNPHLGGFKIPCFVAGIDW